MIVFSSCFQQLIDFAFSTAKTILIFSCLYSIMILVAHPLHSHYRSYHHLQSCQIGTLSLFLLPMPTSSMVSKTIYYCCTRPQQPEMDLPWLLQDCATKITSFMFQAAVDSQRCLDASAEPITTRRETLVVSSDLSTLPVTLGDPGSTSIRSAVCECSLALLENLLVNHYSST